MEVTINAVILAAAIIGGGYALAAILDWVFD